MKLLIKCDSNISGGAVSKKDKERALQIPLYMDSSRVTHVVRDAQHNEMKIFSVASTH